MAQCRICGAPHTACGGPTTVAPSGQRLITKEGDMSLKRYESVVDGNRTTLLLNETDAKRLGLTVAAPKAAPTNKAVKPAASKKPAPATKPTEASAAGPAVTAVTTPTAATE